MSINDTIGRGLLPVTIAALTAMSASAADRCRVERPALRAIAPGRLSACHLYDR